MSAQQRPSRARGDRGGHRGIYLISTLLLLTFLVMLGGAIAVSFQQGLASSGNFNNRQLAMSAAMSGLQYIQARLESNPNTYSPSDSRAAGTTLSVSGALGGFKITETCATVQDANSRTFKAFNVCGALDNTGVAGAGEQKVYLMFRAAFNGSYVSYAALPDAWGMDLFSSYKPSDIGSMPYVSMNSILRSSLLISKGQSYMNTGAAYKVAPTGTADVIVEGLVVTPDGSVLSRRYVEAMLNLVGSQKPSASGVATAASDMNLELYQAGGAVSVSSAANAALNSNAGLASTQGNINFKGKDSGATVNNLPGYNNNHLLASIDQSHKFNYTGAGTTLAIDANTSGQQVVQTRVVQPPSLTVSQLPTQSTPSSVTAGTWVVWNGQMYHYPVDYDTTKTLLNQGWSGGTGGSPPTLNGKSSDITGVPSGFSYDNLTTLTVSHDIAVSSGAGSTPTNGFAVVVAPDSSQPAGFQNKGSAQIVFNASATGDTYQLRAPGNITVVGNVTGQGAIVTTGQSLNGSSAASGDITVVGKSALDTRSDSGVALYAAGSVSVQQLSYAQAPAAVPNVATTLAAMGVTQGSNTSAQSTATSSSISTTTDPAQLAAYFVALAVTEYRSTHPNDEMKLEALKNTIISPGQTVVTSPSNEPKLERWLQAMKPTLTNRDWNSLASQALDSMLQSGAISVTGGDQGNDTNYTVASTSTLSSYAATGTASGSTTTVTPVATPSTTASATSTVADPRSLNQSFNGLVYASKDFIVSNGLGDIVVNGMAVAYGGTPGNASQGAGTSGGTLSLAANNVTLTYDPSTLGAYLALFGPVRLQTLSVVNF